jgi:hypothetical protein
LGKKIPGQIEPGGEIARFSTSGLQNTEGRHSFDLDAWDMAGNHATLQQEVILNKGPPRVVPNAEEVSPGVLELTGNELSFEVRDGNELNYENAAVTFDCAGNRPIVAEIVPPDEKGSRITHKVSLAGLPDGSKGRLTIRIADEFGLRSDQPYEGHRRAVWQFTFARPRVKWRDRVTNWGGMDWVLVVGRDGRDYYISRTEVPNSVYLTLYRKAGAQAPRYWGQGDKLPAYTKEGEPIDLAPFPVVGVMPEDAEKVARALGGRLPLVTEWLDAAWKTNPAGQYPWKDAEAGRDYANCYGAWERPGSPFYEHHYDRMMKYGKNGQAEFRAVEADFDPWPTSAKKTLMYSGEILHLIGNVGELVLREDGSYGIAGGDFSDPYEGISLLRDESVKKHEKTESKTGFRVVIPLGEAPEGFKKAARDTGRK